MSSESLFSICDHVLLEHDEDSKQTILIDNQSGILCTCNETASVILESLKKDCSQQELISVLTQEFEVDPIQASDDVNETARLIKCVWIYKIEVVVIQSKQTNLQGSIMCKFQNTGLIVVRSLILISLINVSVSAGGKINAPNIGERTVWECKGPWTHIYDLTVVKVNDGVITYKGNRDGEDYYVLKRIDYLGTTLWSQQGEDKTQYIDPYYFSGLKDLQLGAVFKGPVPAKIEDDSWVWEYEVGVGKTKKANVSHIGKVDVVTISESRRIYHGTYHTKMQSEIVPSLGITVRWKFSDPFGQEECWLTKYEK